MLLLMRIGNEIRILTHMYFGRSFYEQTFIGISVETNRVLFDVLFMRSIIRTGAFCEIMNRTGRHFKFLFFRKQNRYTMLSENI